MRFSIACIWILLFACGAYAEDAQFEDAPMNSTGDLTFFCRSGLFSRSRSAYPSGVSAVNAISLDTKYVPAGRLIAHIQRMEYVETNFTSSNAMSAADTDRGRVYIKYGSPDDIEHRSSVDDKSSEIWHYRQYIFIFRDPNGLGVYRLMHSTYPGELYNPDWEMQTY